MYGIISMRNMYLYMISWLIKPEEIRILTSMAAGSRCDRCGREDDLQIFAGTIQR